MISNLSKSRGSREEFLSQRNLVNLYLFLTFSKLIHTRKLFGRCFKLTIKTPEQHYRYYLIVTDVALVYSFIALNIFYNIF